MGGPKGLGLGTGMSVSYGRAKKFLSREKPSSGDLEVQQTGAFPKGKVPRPFLLGSSMVVVVQLASNKIE